MDESLIEELLNEPEGPSLDFKVQQYLWVGATDDQKSELLKDILTFANSWRRGDAYILIGVRQTNDGRHLVEGEESHPFDDAHLQQFVNEKTNKDVQFNYEVCRFEGKRLGVIRIPKQERPMYAKRQYGKVSKETVYFRRGSSLKVATLEEVAKMGADDRTEQRHAVPELDVSLAYAVDQRPVGPEIRIVATVYTGDWSSQPTYQRAGLYTGGLCNRGYWRQLAKYFHFRDGYEKLCFRVENRSGLLARRVKVLVDGRPENGLRVEDSEEALARLPSTDDYLGMHEIATAGITPCVRNHASGWTLTATVGDIQPKEVVWSESFLMGPTRSGRLTFQAKVFGDNLPEPQGREFKVEADVRTADFNLGDLNNRAEDIERGHLEGNPFSHVDPPKPW